MVKRYRLLKDLPTFNAGDEFELRDDGCLYLAKDTSEFSWHWKDNVMAYHKNTLARFPVLEDWFEEIEPTKTERIREMLESLKEEIDNYLEENW